MKRIRCIPLFVLALGGCGSSTQSGLIQRAGPAVSPDPVEATTGSRETLRLAPSEHGAGEETPGASVTVRVGVEGIGIDGAQVLQTSTVTDEIRRIEPLAVALDQARRDGAVAVRWEVDERVRYGRLRSLFFTAAQAGFEEFRFVVGSLDSPRVHVLRLPITGGGSNGPALTGNRGLQDAPAVGQGVGVSGGSPAASFYVQLQLHRWRVHGPSRTPVEASLASPDAFERLPGVLSEADAPAPVVIVGPEPSVGWALVARTLDAVAQVRGSAVLSDGPPPAAPSPPSPPSTSSPATGSLAPTLITNAIGAHRRAIRNCYETQLVRDAQLRGQITIAFTIGTDGRVASATATTNTTGNSELGSCMAAAIRAIVFPAPRGGVVRVNYPFQFHPNE